MKKVALIIVLTATIFSCKKDDDSSPTTNNNVVIPTPTPTQTPKEIYVDANIDGVDYSLVAGREKYTVDLNVIGSSQGWHQKMTTSSEVLYGPDNINETYTKLSFEITFIQDHDIQPSDYNEYIDWFLARSSFPYGKDDGSFDEKEEAVMVSSYDDDGVYWSTANGTADQSGSDFRVNELDTLFFDPWRIQTPNVLLKGTFDCTLYDEQGNSKTVKDAQYRLEFGLY